MEAENKSNKEPINIRSLLAGFVGNILEWYDVTVYGYFATVMGPGCFLDRGLVPW